MDSVAVTLTWFQFFIQLKGNTSGAHLDFVKKLKDMGHRQVDTSEESDYILVFCPIISRVGTDVTEALFDIPEGKPIVLVLMYPTFRADYTVPTTRGRVDNPNVQLTTSCLFNKGRLLECSTNDMEWLKVQRFFGGIHPKKPWLSRNWKWIAVLGFVLLVVVVLLSVFL